MKRNRRNNLIITLSILIVLVIGITIVYAALSASLKVTMSNVTQNAASWNVGFEPETVKGTAKNNASSSTAGISCGDATVTGNSISIGATTLTKPGDYCAWDLTVKNSGTIDAKLTAIQTTPPNGISCTGTNSAWFTCGNVRYYFLVPSASYAALGINRILSAKNSEPLALYVTYINESETLNASPVVHTGMSFTLVWSQN